MKQGYNSSDISQQDGQDHARRLYRFIGDIARRLDDARGCARSISDLFTTTQLAQRSRLRDTCERLIFLDPILFGRKIEELLWRKAFYDVVSTSKRLKKQELTPAEIEHLNSHMNAGIGYYHHFISKLQLEFSLNLQTFVDLPSFTEKSNKKLTTKNDRYEWAELSAHRCLIYLGDLSRYKLEINPNRDYGLAIRYYLQASNLKPEYGMPHNQLGTLASGFNNSLDAVYHYMRGLCCTHVFEGTENNLLRLLEKNDSLMENLPVEVSQPADHIKRLIAKFLLLIDNLYFEKKGSHIHSLCHDVLLDLQDCLVYIKPVENGDSPVPYDSPNYLSSEIVFKMTVICLMCIMKKPQLSALKAFLLAVYSQLIQKVIDHIQGSVFQLIPDFDKILQNGNGKKKNIYKRRRKLKNKSDDSDLSESELSIISPSSSDSDESQKSSLSESSDVEDNKTEKNVNGVVETENTVKKVKRMDPMDLLEIVADEGLLRSIKILSDWLTGDISVLRECISSNQSFLKKFVQLLNLINIETFNKKAFKDIQKDSTKIPLPEDIILKGISILELSQRKIDWNYLNKFRIEPKEEACYRIKKLISFGKLLANMWENGISYDKKRKCFTIQEVVNDVEQKVSSTNVDLNEEESKNDSLTRGKLMKHMGQLWLAAEVKDLENKIQGRVAFSPYLVLDIDALINYTHLAKQLVSARKFIVLVPIVVLSALDELKHETIKAREAIRWLETQFQRGNRFLRAQRPQERSSIPLIKYPKKKDKETYTFIQIIECCHFLTQQQKDASNLVTLLIGNQVASDSREISCMGLAQSAGVNLEIITTFHAKWKKSMKGNNR